MGVKSISELKSNAVLSATYDTVLQVLLRIVSFFLNAFIVRHVSSSVFAVISVRLHLLYMTGLLLSREAFRRACLGCQSPSDIKKVVNIIWIGAVVSLPVTAVGWMIWCYVMEAPPLDVTTSYHSGVVLVLISIVVEVCAETPYILAELHMWAKTKVFIEGGMQLVRALLLAVGIMWSPNNAVLAYGVSHLVGSFLYVFAYYGVFALQFRNKENAKKLLVPNFRSLFVRIDRGKVMPEVDKGMWLVSVSFLKQSLLKEALTEGEFYLMNFFPLISLSEQGIYQVVTNLGSLAARLVFRSIELAAYKFFAQSVERGVLIKNQDQSKMKGVSEFVFSLLKNMLLTSAIVVTFGWAYSHALLHLYGGPNLSWNGRGLLRAQCLYVVFLALNGVTEAFTFAAMSDQQLARHNYLLVFFSVVYAIVTVVATYYLGVYGFVVGNCLNMLLRIGRSIHFMKNLFEGSKSNPFEKFSPSGKVVTTFLLSFVAMATSEIYIYPYSFVGHIAVGLITAVCITVTLRELMKDIIIGFLTFLDKIYTKIFRHSEPTKKFNFFVANFIYNWFYR